MDNIYAYEPRMYKQMMLHGYKRSCSNSDKYSTWIQLNRIDEVSKNAHAFNISMVSEIIKKEPYNRQNILPPFPVFWLEGFLDINLSEAKMGIGYLIEGYKKKSVDGFRDVESEGYVFICTTFFHNLANNVIVGPSCSILFESNVDGVLLNYFTDSGETRTFKYHNFSYNSQYEPLRRNSVGGVSRNAWIHFKNICNFLGLINCNNISCPQKGFTANRYNKRILKAKKVNRYHVLKIHKPSEVIKKDSVTGENEGKMPLHVVRGHLKTYDEKGLFGKYYGTFFFPAHVRGKKENGTVVKDYALVN